VLSTCNRAEIYAIGDTDATAEGIARFFSEYHNIPHTEMSGHLYVHRGADAARHLFRVAAGLDSLVVGEPQILGQVKAAYGVASDRQFTAALTNRLFHSAFRRQAGARGDGTRRRGGVGQLRGHRAGEEDLRGPEGAQRPDARRRRDGEADRHSPASAAREADHDREPHAVDGAELAARLGGTAVAVGWLDTRCRRRHRRHRDRRVRTGADARAVEEAMRPRRSGRSSSSTLRVPRDVESAVGELEQVFLYNIDDLRTIVQENLARRGASSRAPRRSSTKRSRSSRRGCSRARSSRPSSRCGSVSKHPAGGAGAARAEARRPAARGPQRVSTRSRGSSSRSCC
jgi:glutamyl-tRNA reductase